MGVNIDLIKQKIAELNGQRKQSNIQMWKPGVGEHKVRILPWKGLKDGEVFIDRQFYYLGNERGFLAPKQFGKPDPIADLVKKLYASNKPDDRLLAKSLLPKVRSYAAVIVRGEEDKGVQIWSFGKIVYGRLLSFFVDEEIGDYTHPETGFDLKVTITQQPGKQFQDTAVDPARRPSKLSDSAENSKKWLENLPNIDEMFKQKTTAEVELILNNYLSGGGPSQEATKQEGTKKGGSSVDELDKLVEEVKPAKAQAKKGKKDAAEESEEQPSSSKSDLDAAFDELMSEE